MCGIVYVRRKHDKQVFPLVLRRYQKQKERGRSGYGYIAFGERGITIARGTTEEEIERKIKQEQAREILFHHRLPTSTPNFTEATHPIPIISPLFKHNYYLVHNGIITNDDELKEQHVARGYTYATDIVKKWITRDTVYRQDLFNDSESLGVELALYLEGKQADITATGATAFILLETTKTGKPRKLHYGRNAGNPLKKHITDDFVALTSEGTGETIRADVLYSYDYRTRTETTHAVNIGSYLSYPTLSAYDRHGHWWNTEGADSEETDFILPDEEYTLKELELETIQAEIEEARKAQNYDYLAQLEKQRENLQQELEELEWRFTRF